jgi:7,8-dihydro-6-hydroxymethylpterin-pyrophosphokinase
MHRRNSVVAFMAVALFCSVATLTGCRMAQTVLKERPDKPRLVAFGMRSFTGSRLAFLCAGDTLLMQSPLMKVKGGSMVEIYEPHGGKPGYMAQTSVFESRLPLENLLGIARSVEERLADPKHPDARQTLRIDILWVEGVSLSTDDVEIPHPAVFSDPEAWAIGTFAPAIEDHIHSRILATRILFAWHNVPPPHNTGLINSDHPPTSLTKGENANIWTVVGDDWSDGLAAAGTMYSQAYIFRELRGLHPIEMVVADLDERMDKEDYNSFDSDTADYKLRENAGDVIHLLESSSPPGSDSSRIANDWLQAVSSGMVHHSMRVSDVVVFSAEKHGVRGAILGSDSFKPIPRLRILNVIADRDPEDLRKWADYHNEPNKPRFQLFVARSFDR